VSAPRGSSRVLAAATLIAALTGLALAAPQKAPAPKASAEPARPALAHPYPNTLPAGPGQEIAERACLMCHAATMITQQAKAEAAWAKTVATMTQWGAPVHGGDRDELVRYLSAHFGRRAAAD
jgi:cytochrome c5